MTKLTVNSLIKKFSWNLFIKIRFIEESPSMLPDTHDYLSKILIINDIIKIKGFILNQGQKQNKNKTRKMDVHFNVNEGRCDRNFKIKVNK